jgi:hypothetical protein
MRKKQAFGIACIMLLLLSATAVWAQTATMRCDPASGTYAAGDTWDMQILIDTDGNAVLSWRAYLQFDDTKVSVEAVTIAPA